MIVATYVAEALAVLGLGLVAGTQPINALWFVLAFALGNMAACANVLRHRLRE